ncbi:MAG TPA: hypothetical protein VFJ45_12250 [bacterium]|nr:hypothetical protein [bacterium]
MQQGIPITDRILRWLPGAGWIWVTLWAVLVLIRPVVFAQVLRLTGTPTGTWEFYQPRLAAHAVLAYMVVLCFWAVRKVAGDAATLEPHLNAMAAHPPAFFLSMWRLHRQLLEAKRRHLAWARRLYTEAYEPVRENVTLEAIRERAPLVSAAEALEKRAGLIQEWPFDDRTMTRIVAISTGVVTAIISRMVLRSVGL